MPVQVWLGSLGKHHLWILPNLTEDCGFFESFKPAYDYKYYPSSADKVKADKAKADAKKAKVRISLVYGHQVSRDKANLCPFSPSYQN